MRFLTLATCIFAFVGCTAPSWPEDEFPAGFHVERTLYAAGGGGLRETCAAIVVELTDLSSSRMMSMKRVGDAYELVPPPGWSNTPLTSGTEGRLYYEGAFGGCENGKRRPLGDLPGALTRPGAFYKVLNGGEGVAIIVPRAKLAGFFYFG